MTDSIADYLTRLRNAIKAQHRVVEVPASNLKKEITKILFEKGYILNYKFVEGEVAGGTIKIALKYDPVDKVNAIKCLKQPSWSSSVYRLQRYAESVERTWNRNHLYVERHHDQQGSLGAESGWRSSMLYLLIRRNCNVKNR